MSERTHSASHAMCACVISRVTFQGHWRGVSCRLFLFGTDALLFFLEGAGTRLLKFAEFYSRVRQRCFCDGKRNREKQRKTQPRIQEGRKRGRGQELQKLLSGLKVLGRQYG